MLFTKHLFSFVFVFFLIYSVFKRGFLYSLFCFQPEYIFKKLADVLDLYQVVKKRGTVV